MLHLNLNTMNSTFLKYIGSRNALHMGAFTLLKQLRAPRFQCVRLMRVSSLIDHSDCQLPPHPRSDLSLLWTALIVVPVDSQVHKTVYFQLSSVEWKSRTKTPICMTRVKG